MTAQRKRILVADDDVHMRGSVVEVLRRKGYEVEATGNGYDALSAFRASQFDIVVSDIKMPQMTGIELLEKIRELDATIPFVVMTAFGDIQVAVDAMKKGAFDFLEKGMNLLDTLEFTLDRALKVGELVNENKRLRGALTEKFDYIGRSASMIDLRAMLETVAQSRATVLVTGESGTGKELVARAVHYRSARANGPFVKVNCAALPEGLIESELFGHEKGAFTGALKTRAGKFELASGGTLLLDEIGEMPTSVQAKLLRVLQEREVDKVGGDAPVEVDVRIVATTNRDLEAEVKKGGFREDLYYRLNVFHVHLPPLRERMDDVPLLAAHFIEKFNDDNGFSVSGLDKAALASLVSHTWPGNIRELENSIERAVVLTRNGEINDKVFSFRPLDSTSSTDPALTPGMTVAEAEKRLILQTLQFCGGNRTKAADMLDISIRTLRNKLNEYGAKDEDDTEL